MNTPVLEPVSFRHVPVLAQTVADLLVQDPGGVYVDGTIGGGGHAAALAERLNPAGRLFGIDRDKEALDAVRHRLPNTERLMLHYGNFLDIPELLDTNGIENVDGILLDLGVSSYQIDAPGRGFSFTHDGPLDMRMDRNLIVTASDLVNHAPREKLIRIISQFGEERMVKPIVRVILETRQRHPVETTGQLASLVRSVVRGRDAIKSCSRVFQALRIAVNEELDTLEAALPTLIFRLKPSGRIAVIAYHSLEDRIVKQTFQKLEKGCICPPEWPVCLCKRYPAIRSVVRRPAVPDEKEIQLNSRSRSARLRAAERLPDLRSGA